MKTSTPEGAVVEGPAGRIEVDINDPGDGRRGIALIAHPHPLMGGTKDNKVVVVPGGGHFFHGRLHLLQSIVTQYCRP